MAESSHPPSRVRLRNGGGGGGGEIVEVQGGHIVRSTGRKDRHSKVCTAKGPRDRRVRLAAHTAIQFYDVQDRLGYDRPSKAVDWLIKKAKSSIDELAQLPPWHPTNCSAPPPNNSSFEQQHEAAAAAAELDHHHHNNHQQQLGLQHDDLMINSVSGASSKRSMAAMLGGEDRGQSSSFLPPSLDSDAIADTIKSFFPMGASAVASSCSAAMQQQQFHSFPTPDFLQSRNTSHSQDLKLSLHSFQDPILLHHHNQQQQNPTHHNTEQTNQEQQHIQGHVLLSGIPLGFDGTSGWGTEHHHQQAAELSRFHRQQSWNSGGGGGGGGDGGNYLFNSPSQPMLQQLLSQNQNQFVSQRGPLQSSNTPSIRAWMDPSAATISTTSTTTTTSDQHYHHHLPIYPSGFGSGIGSFSGFNIPARIQGDQEVHDGYPDKPSSASSDSRH